jgi:radical SAM protein with 4Fe4S-binding SPASM domain
VDKKGRKMKERLFSLVEIEINHSCNLACSYCPNSNSERIEKGEMSLEQFNLITDQLAELNYEGLVSFHFYNEPLLCTKLNEFTAILKNKLPKVRLQIYSNGLFLTLSRTMELFEKGVDFFVITKHEAIKGNFVFDETYEKLEEKYRNKIVYKNFKDIELNNRGGLIPHLSENKEKNYTEFPCMIANMFTVITLKGNVLPCYEDFNQAEVMGNVNEDHIKEIWNSNHYTKFRQKLRTKRRLSDSNLCKQCNNFTIISGEW